MKNTAGIGACAAAAVALFACQVGAAAQEFGANAFVTAAECTAARVGTSIAPSAIGEPVRAVTLSDADLGRRHEHRSGALPREWVDGADRRDSTSRPINFSVALPASWSRRAAQLGGGGMNGVVPNLTGGNSAARARLRDLRQRFRPPGVLRRAPRRRASGSGCGPRRRGGRDQRHPTTGRSTTKRSPTSATCR